MGETKVCFSIQMAEKVQLPKMNNDYN